MADELSPDSIDEGAGEVVISRVGDKIGELGSQLALTINIAMNFKETTLPFSFF